MDVLLFKIVGDTHSRIFVKSVDVFFYFFAFFSNYNTNNVLRRGFRLAITEQLSCTKHSSGSMGDADWNTVEEFRCPLPKCLMLLNI